MLGCPSFQTLHTSQCLRRWHRLELFNSRAFNTDASRRSAAIPCRQSRQLAVESRCWFNSNRSSKRPSSSGYDNDEKLPVVDPIVLPPPSRGSQYGRRDDPWSSSTGGGSDSSNKRGWAAGGGGGGSDGRKPGSRDWGGFQGPNNFNILRRLRLLGLYLLWTFVFYTLITSVWRTMKKLALTITRGATSFVQPTFAGSSSSAAAAAPAAVEEAAPAAPAAPAADGVAAVDGSMLQQQECATGGVTVAAEDASSAASYSLLQQQYPSDEYTTTEVEELAEGDVVLQQGAADVEPAAEAGASSSTAGAAEGAAAGPFANRKLHAADERFNYVGAFVPIYIMIFSSVFFFANV